MSGRQVYIIKKERNTSKKHKDSLAKFQATPIKKEKSDFYILSHDTMNLTLVILAAGMGSRYGRLKQLDGF